VKLRIQRSGGIINRQLRAEVDLKTLPDVLAGRVERALAGGVFPRPSRGGGKGPVADAQQYELDAIAPDGGAAQRFVFDDTSLSPEAADLIDELMEHVHAQRGG